MSLLLPLDQLNDSLLNISLIDVVPLYSLKYLWCINVVII